MVEHCPVHNSEVYLLGLTPRPTVPPPSPPSPSTPTEAEPNTIIDELCLDDVEAFENTPETDSLTKQRLSGAVHVLNTEATALRSLTHLYKTDATATQGFDAAVGAITRHGGERGSKLVICGVGKSGHIAKKLVATFNSLGVHATFLHPTEALHGDLGKIGKHDTVLFITFSGKTAELLALLPHLDAALPVIVLTSHTHPDACEIIRRRPDAILLPAPIHEPETASFGVSAPTTSTTTALALGDALAVVASSETHAAVPSVFARNHPGGAIGQDARKPRLLREIAVPLAEIPVWSPPNKSTNTTTPLDPNTNNCDSIDNGACGADILKLGYDSRSGWARIGNAIASPSRVRKLDTKSLTSRVSAIPDLLVERGEWISIRADTRISQAAEWLREPLRSPGYGGEAACKEDSVLAVVEDGEVVGVLEAGRLLEWQE
ncbi:SIS domain-containing protein [Annulohypoxylon maeteangense]|uniref:SIS domain-containing protein n=1 Tax=Annulohypoxylon maeteangense TaxID=1927788 RepID=UPI002007EFAB|nr:SIS domain-containing protein [Annulohypoxylon maeteangense]KAI0885526.1 SIS domain-containing protein [Annulohypoxylon maeteangense]